MPTNYALRTPIYASASSTVSTTQSAKCLVSVAGTVVYTIIKSASANTTVTFEIAELVRDYLNISYIGNPQFVVFTSTIQFFNQANAGGTAQGTAVSTTSGNGFEAYGLFSEGVNPTIPFENVQKPAWLIAEANPLGAANDRYVIYVPFGVAGKVSYIDTSNNIVAVSYNATDTAIQPSGALRLEIRRIDCTKYGDGRMITFINKFGVIQDLWFFLKRVKKINRTNESYMSNTLTFDNLGIQPPNYSQQNAPKKLLNTQAKQTHTLSSGYYPESANLFFEQLLLSEYVWYTRPEDTQPNTEQVIPVIVKSSSIVYKTSLNDRLVEYTIEFEDAFDYINNIR
tara:strand:+ start:15725 stop:16747 length:1023 start_codon:yes stop_codon:yes gene_type:complete